MEAERREAEEGSSSQNNLPQNIDHRLMSQESLPPVNSVPVDEEEAVLVDRQNQVILLETLDQEVTKFRECNALLDLNSLFTEAKIYHGKLINIRKDMIMLHEKTTKLKKRALKLQQQRQKEALEKEQQREKELERERQLIAKPAKRL
ncbi:biogenesis of lysosome-related organelles complex 1 subunit 6 isoform X2 [Osmerus mordax]|uniref:Pallidin n=1 Tax=Osmerus mordax TaxID=8014 RepID=C1BKY2_OSMMO|nr:Pallidin [Osmerus mordax]